MITIAKQVNDAVSMIAEVPSLTQLSGHHRGRVKQLVSQAYHLIAYTGSGRLDIIDAQLSKQNTILAQLHRSGKSYEIVAQNNRGVRVNGRRISNLLLCQGDVIEFDNSSVLLKFGFVEKSGGDKVKIGTIFDDCLKRTRFEANSRGGFLARLPLNILVDLTERGNLKFRAAVMVALTVLLSLNMYQWFRSNNLEQIVAEERQSLEGLASWFKKQQHEYISREELQKINDTFKSELSLADQRVSILESRSTASQRIISEASRAVIFLQGSWVYQEIESGRKLRYVVTKKGYPLVNRYGHPHTTLEGDGPVASQRFTGTAFVISANGRLLTNRHVAQPWENDRELESMKKKGIVPVFENFIGYLPDTSHPFNVSQDALSNRADLAVLQCAGVTEEIPHIPLASEVPMPGDEVFVLGYPTGLRALLARSNQEFIKQIETEKLDFWSIASRLAQQNMIRPLVSRGIVGQVSQHAIALDADTTVGGSGGPVLNSDGELVAVIKAILPEYGGSNIGVPVTQVVELINEVGSSS